MVVKILNSPLGVPITFADKSTVDYKIIGTDEAEGI